MNWSHLFSLFLLMLSGGMLWFHIRSWRIRRNEALPEHERVFFWRQCLRRVFTSGLIGLIGAAVSISQVFTDPTTTGFYWYWTALMTVVIVLGVLALADMRSSHQYTKQVIVSNIVPHRFPPPVPSARRRSDATEQDS